MASPPETQESSPEKEADRLQDAVSPWDSTSQVSRRSSRTSRSSRSSRSVRSATERAEHRAQIAALQVQLESEQRLADLRARQVEVALANETKVAKARADLEVSIARDEAFEEDEAESEDEEEEESSHERRLKRHYAFPDMGGVTVEDGAKACQVRCGLDTSNFKVINERAPSTRKGFPLGEEASKEPQGPEAPRPTGDWGGARPKARGDVEAPTDPSADQEGPPGGGRTPDATEKPRRTTREPREPTEPRPPRKGTLGPRATTQGPAERATPQAGVSSQGHTVTEGLPRRDAMQQLGRGTARSPQEAGTTTMLEESPTTKNS